MHSRSIDQWTHDHVFLGSRHDRHERRTWFVVVLTAAMMVGEIVVGWLSGSMALLADGWHMATHAAALGIAALAYLFARRQAGNSHFTFGTGKFGDLAAFSSAIILTMIAVQIAYESVVRLLHPVPIAYGEAIAVAALGLVVNIVSAWLLRDDHDHHHGHGHDHDHVQSHSHRHDDNNLRAAYVHVMADAATSILAIAALLAAMYAQWGWADPAVGIIGSLVIARWAYGLLRASGAVLLDVNADKNLEMVIRERLETKGDRVTDLHLWQVGPGHRAAVISVVSDHPLPPSTYKRRPRRLARAEPCDRRGRDLPGACALRHRRRIGWAFAKPITVLDTHAARTVTVNRSVFHGAGIHRSPFVTTMRPLFQLDLRSVGRAGLFKAKAIFWLAWTWYLAACASQYHFLSGSLSARRRHSASSSHKRVTSFIANSRAW